jgi:hypothetical protein
LTLFEQPLSLLGSFFGVHENERLDREEELEGRLEDSGNFSTNATWKRGIQYETLLVDSTRELAVTISSRQSGNGIVVGTIRALNAISNLHDLAPPMHSYF